MLRTLNVRTLNVRTLNVRTLDVWTLWMWGHWMWGHCGCEDTGFSVDFLSSFLCLVSLQLSQTFHESQRCSDITSCFSQVMFPLLASVNLHFFLFLSKKLNWRENRWITERQRNWITQFSVWHCLFVADPATFLDPNIVLGPDCPLTTACLLTDGHSLCYDSLIS